MGRKGAEARWQKRDKATDAPSTASPDSAASRAKKLREAVWWVMDNPEDDKPPSELARKLQKAYKNDESAFLRDVVKQVLAADKGAEPEPEGEQYEGEYRKMLEEMLAEIEGRPKANDGPVVQNDRRIL
jgi:hypothetical protein